MDGAQGALEIPLEFAGCALGAVGNGSVFQPVRSTTLHAVRSSGPMYSLIVAGAIVLVGVALGRWVLGWLGYRTGWSDETLVLGGGLGLGILSYAVLGVGLLGWLYPGGILGLLAIALLISHRALFATLADVRGGLRKLARWRPSPWQAVPLVFLMAFLLLDLLGALAPPTEADALIGHLAIPAIYVRAHRIIDVPYNIYSYLPFGVQMLYTAGLMLDNSGIVAALVHYGYGVLILLAIYVLGKRYFSRTVGLWGALFFASAPLVMQQMSVPMVDLGPTLYFTLTILALLHFWESRSLRWTLLAGVFSGLAIGAKLQPLFLVTALGVVFLVACLVKQRERPLSKRVLPILAFGLPTILVASPWFIKNWWYTGNPIYPHLYSIFGGTNWSPALAQLLEQHIKNKAAGYDLSTFLLTPWLMLAHSDPLNIGYYAFALVPFALGWRSQRRLWWTAAAVVGVYYVLWFFFIYQRHRHFIYLLPVLSVLAAAGLTWLLTTAPVQRWARYAVQGLVVTGLVALLGVAFVYQRKAIPVVLAMESREAYLDKYGYIQEPYRWANANLAPGSRIFVRNLWDMTYYLNVDYVLGNPLVQGYIDYTRMQSPEDLLHRLRELGVTHMFVVGAVYSPDVASNTRNDTEAGEYPAVLHRADQLVYGLARSQYARIVRSFDYQKPASRTLGQVSSSVRIDLIALRELE